MLEITVLTEKGHRHVRPTARELATLVHRIGGQGDMFLVVQPIPDLPHVFIQVWHRAGGDYTLEHRDGGPDRHFQVKLDDPEPIVAALAGWARREDAWRTQLPWQRLDLGPAPAPVPPLDLDDQDREELEDHLRQALLAGYITRAELAELAEDYLADIDDAPVSPAQAAQLADRLWLERVTEQAAWQGETDPERLTRAFTALNASGITARENFTCCRNCGHSEIAAEAAPGARGFVYFHQQCTDSAAAGHGLTLFYGTFNASRHTTATIGKEIVTALESAGLSAEWNGDPARSINVTHLNWQRRLVG
ncbi:DUF6891 domain-containing protein [Streptomyces orinoci]|uniref:DUF6891 domain-containing protein n=1 Tax=Streptomyces orinoci TaxID=67339 RepID=A0ABV3K5Q9_STRON|nr:hypothetical protein [Streptomyces orinoci]